MYFRSEFDASELFSWLAIKSVAQRKSAVIVKLLYITVRQVNMNVIGIVQQFVQAGPVP